MYGMVNEGIHTFVSEHLGTEAWHTICETSGVKTTEFERMASYPDEVTYALVGGICTHTGLSASEALNRFGTYWVDFAGNSSYGNLLQLAGRTFLERLDGLDDMHERILLSMPHLTPPSFELEDDGSGTYRLHYHSERDGLAPMVVGLLHGLAQLSGEKIEVRQVSEKSEGADHDIFEIVLRPSEVAAD